MRAPAPIIFSLTVWTTFSQQVSLLELHPWIGSNARLRSPESAPGSAPRSPRNVRCCTSPRRAARPATDHPRLSQCPEVLRERGLRNCLIANVQKHGAVMRALLSHYVCIDRHPDRVGQGMEDSLY